MRKLASIQKILGFEPIPGKDNIHLALVLGWKVICRKEDFQIGDFCVYFEVDSILPQRPEFEFLRKSCFSPRYNGFRIRIMKMGGVFSYGLALPVKTLFAGKDVHEGEDVTKLLGVTKYDPEATTEKIKEEKPWWVKLLWRFGIFKKKRTGSWPNEVPKTDETRLQAIPHVLDTLKEKSFYITLKLDGCSSTYFIKKNDFGVCSRNIRIKKAQKQFHSSLSSAGNLYWEMVTKYDIENKLKKYYKETKRQIALQGEIVGPSVQGNPHKLKERNLYLYQIWDIDKKRYFDFEDFLFTCTYLGFKTVPFLYPKDYPQEFTVDSFVKAATRSGCLEEDAECSLSEGIVVRSKKEMQVHGLETMFGRLSFKVINPEYMLKEN